MAEAEQRPITVINNTDTGIYVRLSASSGDDEGFWWIPSKGTIAPWMRNAPCQAFVFRGDTMKAGGKLDVVLGIPGELLIINPPEA